MTCEIWGAWPEGYKMWIKKFLLQLSVTNDMMGIRGEENDNNRDVSLIEMISSHFSSLISHYTKLRDILISSDRSLG